jgi:thioredoxin-related protein
VRKIFRLLFVSLVALGCTSSSVSKPPILESPPVIVTEIGDIKNQKVVEWRPPSNRSFLEAHQTRKPVFIYMYLDGCPYCGMVEFNVFTNQAVVEVLNNEFVPIRMNAEDHGGNMLALGTNVVPSMAMLTPDGEHMLTIEGVIPVEKLYTVLRMVSEHTKKLDDQSPSERESVRNEYIERQKVYRL